VGCACFNSAENQVLSDEAPEDYAATLSGTIDEAARHACDSLVPAGYDHNCYLDGPGEPQAETPSRIGLGECVGDCAYTDDCGDPDPYECENIVDGRSSEPDGGETGSESGGGGNLGLYIDCSGDVCDVDESFAAMLWSDPSLLLSESTRLIYQPADRRFVFATISTGTLAAELGFRDGDILDSVNGVIIDDLDTALAVYASNHDARSLRVRVARRGQWIDFTFNFVR
jgi:hypothetical protein